MRIDRKAHDAYLRAILPFAQANQALREKFKPQPDDHRIVQLGGIWLTWGDFRRAGEAWAIPFERDDDTT